ncbi:MAG: tail fiber domain-containing protein [Bacteroidia bacterium]|nr:tail fiber domain-containing protein [Bacteroidia bacterium]
MKRIFITLLGLLCVSFLFAQTEGISINTTGNKPDSSAMLDIQSTTKGMLIPRMDSTQRKDINNAAKGLMVFDNTTSSFWFYNGAAWVELGSGSSRKLSDADEDTRIEVEATADEDIIRFTVGDSERFQVSPYGILSKGKAQTNYNGAIPDSGAGNRLMWVPKRSAFRVGIVSGTGWNVSQLGLASAVVGGINNIASGSLSFIGGGIDNSALGDRSFIAGGRFNVASELNTFVAGGYKDTASGDYAFVGGGQFNKASGGGAFIGGGVSNVSSALLAFVGGGQENTATGRSSFVGGGIYNRTSGELSFIGGGRNNAAPSRSEAVFGEYTETYTPSSATAFDPNDRLFVIGNGTSNSNRSNALTLLKNGNLGLGESIPDHTLDIVGDMQVSGLSGTGTRVVVADSLGVLSTQTLPTGATFSDDDQDTRIEVEATPDEDVIRFSVADSEIFKLSPEGLVSSGTFQSSFNVSLPDSGAGTRMMWIPQLAAFRVGRIYGTQWNLSQVGYYSSVVGGVNNITSGNNSFIGGGVNNVITGRSSFVGAGEDNQVSGNYSFLGGGLFNDVSGIFSFVGGGSQNSVSGDRSFVGGGTNNTISGFDSFMGGGTNNTISNYGQGAFVGGGNSNTNSGLYSFIGGGRRNTVSGANSFVGGGFLNTVSGNYAFVGGGNKDTASGVYSFIGGGRENKASGETSFLGGGRNNEAPSRSEAVFGEFAETYTPNSATAFDLDDRLFVVGNGTSTSNRSNAMTILKNGHVGIGTASPQHLVDLGQSIGRKLAVYQNASGTSFHGFAMSSNTLELHAGSNVGGAPLMALKKSGRVGIGTTDPQSKLDVSGGITIGASYAGTTAAPTNGVIIEGNVGIGTDTPTKAKLQIEGTVSSSIGSHAYLINNSNPFGSVTGRSNSGRTTNYSLWANGRIAASEFHAFSDARIKHIQGISDSKTDLSTLMQIEVTDYRLRDSIAKGNKAIKKVIAQQVAEVYPQAVSRNLTEVVPDIYQRAELREGWIMLATDLKAGERVKLITEKASEVYKVTAVEKDRFQVSNLTSDSTSGLTSQVFVYGREVDDFHTVDYEAISMLNVSATQEQQRRIEALEAANEAIQLQNAELKAQMQALRNLEARLQALETQSKTMLK